MSKNSEGQPEKWNAKVKGYLDAAFEAKSNLAEKIGDLVYETKKEASIIIGDEDKVLSKIEFSSGKPEGRKGLALSGGGIRSAAFGLGVVQALLEKKVYSSNFTISPPSRGADIRAAPSVGSIIKYSKNKYRKTPSPTPKRAMGLNLFATMRVTWCRPGVSIAYPCCLLFSGRSLSRSRCIRCC